MTKECYSVNLKVCGRVVEENVMSYMISKCKFHKLFCTTYNAALILYEKTFETLFADSILNMLKT